MLQIAVQVARWVRWCCPEISRVGSILRWLLGSVREEPRAAAQICRGVGVTGCAHDCVEDDCCPGVRMMLMSAGVPGKAAWGADCPGLKWTSTNSWCWPSSRGAQLRIPQKHGFHNSNVYLSLISWGQVPRLWLHPPPLPAGCCPCWLLLFSGRAWSEV